MHKVIAINLNGVAFQLDDTAYDALRAYLDGAELHLRDNPDRAEILADLEQAIGEKCSAFLGPHKTVVTGEEIERIIREMGPVDGGAGDSRSSGPASDRQDSRRERSDQGPSDRKTENAPPRRLYNIREGALISGVCAGIAAYFHIDVTIVRIVFVILTIVTKGAWLLVYAVLMFVVPYANTSEERAAAYGQPFSAQDLIDQAKRNYAGFDKKEWKRQWRQQRREWRERARAARRAGRAWGPVWVPPLPTMHWPGPTAGPVGTPAGYAAQVWAGVTLPIVRIIGAALFVLLLLSIVSLVNAHAVFGWPAPPGLPLWVGIIILVGTYSVMTSALHAVRHAAYAAAYHAGYPFAPWGGLLWLASVAAFSWLAYQYIPEVRGFVDNLPAFWDSVRR
jgi:phage shock protein PspC (stress-responsive transcriptional regulator)